MLSGGLCGSSGCLLSLIGRDLDGIDASLRIEDLALKKGDGFDGGSVVF